MGATDDDVLWDPVEPARPRDLPSTINEAGTGGFAVDGTDSFAIEAAVHEPVLSEAPDPANRRRLAVTMGALAAGLVVVIVAGSSTGQRPVVGETAQVRTDDRTDATEPTSTSDDDGDRQARVGAGRGRRQGATSRVGPLDDEPAEVPIGTLVTGTSDELDQYVVEAFDDDLWAGSDDDGDTSSGRTVVQRRVPAAPYRPRIVVPYRPPAPSGTTATSSTVTTVAVTTTTNAGEAPSPQTSVAASTTTTSTTGAPGTTTTSSTPVQVTTPSSTTTTLPPCPTTTTTTTTLEPTTTTTLEPTTTTTTTTTAHTTTTTTTAPTTTTTTTTVPVMTTTTIGRATTTTTLPPTCTAPSTTTTTIP